MASSLNRRKQGYKMKINIRNKTITSVDFSNTEVAWAIEDAMLVLDYLNGRNEIVLGGDILTKDLEYSYDNWYYDVNPGMDSQSNADCSIKRATEYLSSYIKANGNTFYVVFVLDSGLFVLK